MIEDWLLVFDLMSIGSLDDNNSASQLAIGLKE